MDGPEHVQVSGRSHVALVGREAEDGHRQLLLLVLLRPQRGPLQEIPSATDKKKGKDDDTTVKHKKHSRHCCYTTVVLCITIIRVRKKYCTLIPHSRPDTASNNTKHTATIFTKHRMPFSSEGWGGGGKSLTLSCLTVRSTYRHTTTMILSMSCTTV